MKRQSSYDRVQNLVKNQLNRDKSVEKQKDDDDNINVITNKILFLFITNPSLLACHGLTTSSIIKLHLIKKNGM